MNILELKKKLEELASKSYDLAKELEELQEFDFLNEVYQDNIGAGRIIESQFDKSVKKMYKAYDELNALAGIA